MQEGKSLKLPNVSRKTGSLVSSIMTATVLILSLLCKGTLSQLTPSFKLTMPASVYVQRGLYVHPPCQFTYNNQHQNSSEKLFGYWFKEAETRHYLPSSKRYVKGGLVATNDESRRIDPSTANRFQLEGKPEQGDCSFSISDVQLEDEGRYYFRIEKGQEVHYSYVDASFQLLVTDVLGLSSTRANATCWQRHNGFLCTCSLHPSPPGQLQWQVVGEVLSGNDTNGNVQVSSWVRGKEATSFLNWTGSLDGDLTIICLGISPFGSHTLQFLLNYTTTGAHSEGPTGESGQLNNTILSLLALSVMKVLICCFLFLPLFGISTRGRFH